MADASSSSDQWSSDAGDAQLMERVVKGDIAAFDTIVQRYWRTTHLYVYHLVHDAEKASDVTQEAFSRLWQQRAKWQPSGSLGGWLLRVARNLVINDRRKWRLHMNWTSLVSREEARGPRTPLQDTEVAEMSTALQEAIDALPPRRREVFILFHLQDLSHREIADILGIRPQTVANHLHDAAVELRANLKRFVERG